MWLSMPAAVWAGSMLTRRHNDEVVLRRPGNAFIARGDPHRQPRAPATGRVKWYKSTMLILATAQACYVDA